MDWVAARVACAAPLPCPALKARHARGRMVRVCCGRIQGQGRAAVGPLLARKVTERTLIICTKEHAPAAARQQRLGRVSTGALLLRKVAEQPPMAFTLHMLAAPWPGAMLEVVSLQHWTARRRRRDALRHPTELVMACTLRCCKSLAAAMRGMVNGSGFDTVLLRLCNNSPLVQHQHA